MDMLQDLISKNLVNLIGLVISTFVLTNKEFPVTNRIIIVTIIILILLVLYFRKDILEISKSISSKITKLNKLSELEKEKEELKGKIRQQYKVLKNNNKKLEGVINKLNLNKLLEAQDIAELNEAIQELKNLEHLVKSSVENIERGFEIVDSSADTGRDAEEWLKNKKNQNEG